MIEDKELFQRLSERTCGAYKHREEFLLELKALMERYPIDMRINYDFRTKKFESTSTR